MFGPLFLQVTVQLGLFRKRAVFEMLLLSLNSMVMLCPCSSLMTANKAFAEYMSRFACVCLPHDKPVVLKPALVAVRVNDAGC
jgi:hypothetical protein